MKNFFNNPLSGFRESILRRLEEKETRKNRYSDILGTVDDVVNATDSRIRLVTNYKKKLLEAVSSALDFTDDMVEQIPGAIDINRKTFVSDPYVNAFFANIPDMQSVFSRSSEIRDFLEDSGNATSSECCSLLCMHMSEKTVMGMQLSGDIIRKDVQQTAVNFSDHRIYSPSPDERSTREGLKHCLFGGLVTNAIERIMQLKLENHRLQSERQMLHARLRHLQQKAAQTQDSPPDNRITADIEDTSLKLKNVEDKLLHTHPASPQESLELVNHVFGYPEEFVRARKFTLRLNKMGIKIEDNSTEPSNRIELTEVVISNELPRVITLAKFPRNELLPDEKLPAHSLFS
jgi:hypothetical protein